MATVGLIAVIIGAVAALIGALVALLNFFYGLGKDVERRDDS